MYINICSLYVNRIHNTAKFVYTNESHNTWQYAMEVAATTLLEKGPKSL